MDEQDLHPAHPRQSPVRAWVILGSLLALILACIAVFVVIPTIRPKGFDPYPSRAMIAPLALLAGFGIALPFACLWPNRGQRRAMLRFKWGRAISAVLLAGLLPIGLFGVMPIALGFATAMPLLVAFEPNAGPPLATLAIAQATFIACCTLAYPLACGIIYSLTMPWRIPAFITTISGPIALLLLMGFSTSGQL